MRNDTNRSKTADNVQRSVFRFIKKNTYDRKKKEVAKEEDEHKPIAAPVAQRPMPKYVAVPC